MAFQSANDQEKYLWYNLDKEDTKLSLHYMKK